MEQMFTIVSNYRFRKVLLGAMCSIILFAGIDDSVAFSENLLRPQIGGNELLKRTFIGMLRNRFGKLIEVGSAINILDAGTGRRPVFCEKLHNLLIEARIEHKIHGRDFKLSDRVIEEIGTDAIRLTRGYVENLAKVESEKGKYHLIIVNAPYFLVHGGRHDYLKEFDFLLEKNGLIIVRHQRDSHLYALDIALESSFIFEDSWEATQLDHELNDLPRGSVQLGKPILIERATLNSAL